MVPSMHRGEGRHVLDPRFVDIRESSRLRSIILNGGQRRGLRLRRAQLGEVYIWRIRNGGCWLQWGIIADPYVLLRAYPIINICLRELGGYSWCSIVDDSYFIGLHPLSLRRKILPIRRNIPCIFLRRSNRRIFPHCGLLCRKVILTNVPLVRGWLQNAVCIVSSHSDECVVIRGYLIQLDGVLQGLDDLFYWL